MIPEVDVILQIALNQQFFSQLEIFCKVWSHHDVPAVVVDFLDADALFLDDFDQIKVVVVAGEKQERPSPPIPRVHGSSSLYKHFDHLALFIIKCDLQWIFFVDVEDIDLAARFDQETDHRQTVAAQSIKYAVSFFLLK